jgi:hypothetical protein
MTRGRKPIYTPEEAELRTAYYKQRRSAKYRDIEWLFTFEEWLALWLASGKLDQRGLRKDQYVMARKGDVGPYSVSNVEICTASENGAQRGTNGRSFSGPRATARGWYYVKCNTLNPYVAQACGTRIGAFPTEEAALAARQAFVDAYQRGSVSADPAPGSSVVHPADGHFFDQNGQP